MTETKATRGFKFGAIVEVGFLVWMIGAGLVAWSVGIVTRGYDYDEVLRAHSIWLTTRGLRPYNDFFEVHPPYFVLLSPMVRVFADPVEALLALRIVSALGNLLFLGGLVAIARKSLPPEASGRWAWLGVGFIAFNPYIIDFLVEFRVDGWGYAAIAWSTVLFLRRSPRAYRSLEFGALSAIAAALFAPKMVLLPPLIALCDQIARFESWRGFLRSSFAYLAGVGIAAALFAGYLIANGIGIERTTLLLGRYHAVSNLRAGFRYGLLGQIVSIRMLLIPIVAGFGVWSLGRLRRWTLGNPYELALIVWLVAQMFLVTYPYKQYYAPWFLFASGFVPFLGPIVAMILKRVQAVIYVLACVVTIHASIPIVRFWAETNLARTENALIHWMGRVARPEDKVVGSPPYHPIDRFDTFFLSFNTSDPKGFDSERIFEELPGLRSIVAEDRYRAELDDHPPAFVVLQSPDFEVTHPSRQRAVLEAFMSRRGYRMVRIGRVLFAIRPDRFEDAKRRGDLD